MTQRKYWVGVSDLDDHTPDDFITFVATSTEDIDEGMELVRDYFKDDLAEADELEDIHYGADDI